MKVKCVKCKIVYECSGSCGITNKWCTCPRCYSITDYPPECKAILKVWIQNIK